ncbi:MAG: glycerol-3-phosphate acyltransferase [Actinobacteria bacterium]|nr:glycerol-3-phosphate acyltransferase [Actinomycetota bacterium]
MVESIYFKIFYVIASYLLGSVVFGYIIARILGKEGFGKIDRPGTAGAGRQYGFKAALPTFLFDCGKGVLVPLLGIIIGLDMYTIIIASLAVLIGHNWPVFFKFRGGGGIATAMGTAAVLLPVQFFIVLAIALIIGFTYKYTLKKKHKVNQNVVSSLFAVIVLPPFVYLWQYSHKWLVWGNWDRWQDTAFLIFILTVGFFIIIVAKGIILHMIYRKVPTAG